MCTARYAQRKKNNQNQVTYKALHVEFLKSLFTSTY